ncbi:MAG: choice-of-anchor V domain-containing protein [Deltaproteobacteria bacterium]|nr:choice-of-anchor V domain-containing protein [Deltaproteobacteria bacterium]
MIRTNAWFAACAALIATALPWTAHAYSEGITNRSASGCLGIVPSCHNSAAARNDGAMVALEGPTMLAAGQRATYTLRIRRTDMNPLAVGGLDVSTTGGALAATSTNLRIANCELTHRLPVAVNAATMEVAIPFDFIAPASAATVTLNAAGNGADGNSEIRGAMGQTGDQWGTTTLAITVTGTSATGGQCPEPSTDAGTTADASDASDANATSPDSSDAIAASDAASSDSDLGDAGAVQRDASDVVDDRAMMAGGGCQCSTPTQPSRTNPIGLALSALALVALRPRNRTEK